MTRRRAAAGILSRSLIAACVAGAAVAAGFGVPTARADDCGCSLVPSPGDGSDEFDLKLTGSSDDWRTGFESLNDGEMGRRVAGLEVGATPTPNLKLTLRTNFTQLLQDPEKALLSLPSLNLDSRNRQSHVDTYFRVSLFDNRFSLISDTRMSDSVALHATDEPRGGRSDVVRMSADVLRWSGGDLSLTSAVSHVDPNYFEFGSVPSTDPLKKTNQATHQFAGRLTSGRFKFYALQRSSSALVANGSEIRPPTQSSTEVGASASLVGLWNKGGDGVIANALALLPDAVWISMARGSLYTGGAGDGQPKTTTVSAGASRSWNNGSVYLGSWQSTVQSAPNGPDLSVWRGHGLDVGGSLYSKRFSLSGNVSLYRADNRAQWNNLAENSTSGSLFATWRPSFGPDVLAGVTTFQYQNDYFSYGGFDANHYLQYELAFDFARLIAANSSRKDIHLRLVGSYQKNENVSQWLQSDYLDSAGGLVLGFQFGLVTS